MKCLTWMSCTFRMSCTFLKTMGLLIDFLSARPLRSTHCAMLFSLALCSQGSSLLWVCLTSISPFQSSYIHRLRFRLPSELSVETDHCLDLPPLQQPSFNKGWPHKGHYDMHKASSFLKSGCKESITSWPAPISVHARYHIAFTFIQQGQHSRLVISQLTLSFDKRPTASPVNAPFFLTRSF